MQEEDSPSLAHPKKTDVSELQDDMKFSYALYIIGAIICFLTALVLAYITYKVIKKVGATDKIIPAMLIMLQLSAISKYCMTALCILK